MVDIIVAAIRRLFVREVLADEDDAYLDPVEKLAWEWGALVGAVEAASLVLTDIDESQQSIGESWRLARFPDAAIPDDLMQRTREYRYGLLRRPLIPASTNVLTHHDGRPLTASDIRGLLSGHI